MQPIEGISNWQSDLQSGLPLRGIAAGDVVRPVLEQRFVAFLMTVGRVPAGSGFLLKPVDHERISTEFNICHGSVSEMPRLAPSIFSSQTKLFMNMEAKLHTFPFPHPPR